MRTINLPHYERWLVDVSRELYRRHDWEMPEGLRDGDKRDPLNFSRLEAGQVQRLKGDARDLKAMFQQFWDRSYSFSAFAAVLKTMEEEETDVLLAAEIGHRPFALGDRLVVRRND